jgi:hypothetical protein
MEATEATEATEAALGGAHPSKSLPDIEVEEAPGLSSKLRRYNTIRSEHTRVILPDGSEEWQNVTCPPGGRAGMMLEVTDKGHTAMVLVPHGVGPGDRFNAKPVHFDTTEPQNAYEDESNHRLEPLPDGGWIWRDILCRSCDKPGTPLQVGSRGVNMVVVVPPGTKPGDLFDARPIEGYDLSKKPHQQTPAIQKLISGDKLK